MKSLYVFDNLMMDSDVVNEKTEKVEAVHGI